MKTLGAFAFVLLLAGVSAQSYVAGSCIFRGTDVDPDITGYIVFAQTEGDDSVTVSVNVQGITENVGVPHGIHIHQFGDLSDTAGAASVGSHYQGDNTSSLHNCPDIGPGHYGDMGNWDVSSDGNISQNKTLSGLKLKGNYSIIGHAVVIHNKTDDCLSTSSAAKRLAFCVIGISNPAVVANASVVNTATNDATTTAAATCDLVPINGSGISGRVWLTQASGEQTLIRAKLIGASGPHGMHIHKFGQLVASADLSVAGGHYDPFNTSVHAIPPKTPRHVGDMGNVYHYDSESTNYWYEYTNELVNLTGVNNVIGRAIIIHAIADPCNTTLGARVAQCVIGIANSPFAAYTNLTIPTTQDTSACIAATTGDATTASATTAQITTGDQLTTGVQGYDTAAASILQTGFTYLCMMVLALVA